MLTFLLIINGFRKYGLPRFFYMLTFFILLAFLSEIPATTNFQMLMFSGLFTFFRKFRLPRIFQILTFFRIINVFSGNSGYPDFFNKETLTCGKIVLYDFILLLYDFISILDDFIWVSNFCFQDHPGNPQ